jgi:putative aldouronate transport system substrate-binding protein
MKNTVKSLLALAMMLCLVLSLFVGCGSTTDADDSSDADNSGSETVSTDAPQSDDEAEATEPAEAGSITMPLSDEEVTFTWWNAMNPNLVQYLDDMNDILVYQKMEELSNVHIDWVTVSAAVESEQFNIMLSTEDYTDICGSSMGSYSGGDESALADDIIIDLTELMPTNAPDYWNLITADDANYKELSTSDGKIISFDVVYSDPVGIDFGPQIREDLLDELGMEKPQTYDEMYDFLTACKNELGLEGGLLLPQQSATYLNYLSAGFGVAAYLNDGMGGLVGPFYQVDGEVKFGPFEDGFSDYLSLMSSWYSEGLINRDYVSLGNGWNPDQDTVLNGQAAVWYDDRGNIDTYNANATVDGFKCGGTYDLVQNVGDQLHFDEYGYTVSMNSIYILSVCEQPEIACQYFNYRYTEDGELLGNWGVEGETFEYDTDGNPHYTDLIVNNELYGPEYALQVYCLWRAPMLTDCNKFADIYSADIIEASEIWGTNRDNSYKIPDGVSMDSDASDEYSQLLAEVATYYSEMVPKFITGEVSLDQFDSFVSTLQDLGADRCIELWQEALDTYNAK